MLVLNRIPMNNSVKGVEHRQDYKETLSRGCVGALRAHLTKRPPPAGATQTVVGQFWKLLRISPTARPSISKASPGSTTMVL